MYLRILPCFGLNAQDFYHLWISDPDVEYPEAALQDAYSDIPVINHLDVLTDIIEISQLVRPGFQKSKLARTFETRAFESPKCVTAVRVKGCGLWFVTDRMTAVSFCAYPYIYLPLMSSGDQTSALYAYPEKAFLEMFKIVDISVGESDYAAED